VCEGTRDDTARSWHSPGKQRSCSPGTRSAPRIACSPHRTYCHVVSGTREGVSIGKRIYRTLALVTTNNYDSLTELHTEYITVTTAHRVFSVFTSRCLVAAFNGGRFPSSGFPHSPRPQLPKKLAKDRGSAGQSVLVSSPQLGPKTRGLSL
jgi:hypothetical protein